jgi:hypothetical protein
MGSSNIVSIKGALVVDSDDTENAAPSFQQLVSWEGLWIERVARKTRTLGIPRNTSTHIYLLVIAFLLRLEW